MEKMTMIECNCKEPHVEYIVAKDCLSKIILVQAYCENCGRTASGKGYKVEEALKEVEKKWKKQKGIHR